MYGELALDSLDQVKHCFVLFSLPGINTARPNDLPSAALPRMNERMHMLCRPALRVQISLTAWPQGRDCFTHALWPFVAPH